MGMVIAAIALVIVNVVAGAGGIIWYFDSGKMTAKVYAYIGLWVLSMGGIIGTGIAIGLNIADGVI